VIYIAFLRGINVGGKNLLPMKELAAILEDLDCRRASTYVQSGNAVFESTETIASRLSEMISAEIKRRRGFEPRVLLLKPEDIERAITENPFPEAESIPKSLHIGFLDTSPSEPDLETLESIKSDSERYRLIERRFYLHAPEGVGRSRLAANAEKLLGVPLTDRNWNTVQKVREMAKKLA
jgi:uncharacterized protein (DUF1697 family)